MTVGTHGLRYRIERRVHQRDPENDGFRRALRAALVVPLAGAASFLMADNNPQTPLYTIFGSVALLVFSDFPGNRQNRAVAYAGLALSGFVMITLGTLVAPHPVPSVLLMFALGVVVSFSGVFSETIAAGQRATLVTFVLPACTPPDRSRTGCWGGPSRWRSACRPRCSSSHPVITVSSGGTPRGPVAPWPTGWTGGRLPLMPPLRWTRCGPTSSAPTSGPSD